MKPLQQMSHVLAANFETVVYVFAAYQGTKYLNEHYPQSFPWTYVTYSLALLMILRSWYVVFRSLLRDQKRDEQKEKEKHAKDL